MIRLGPSGATSSTGFPPTESLSKLHKRLNLDIFSVARDRLFMALGACVLMLGGCVGPAANPPPPAGQKSVRFGHVFIVVEENHNYGDVVASASMPYFNGLANKYGLAANYFANGHPSIPDYFMLTTEQTLTLIHGVTPQTFPVYDDYVVR